MYARTAMAIALTPITLASQGPRAPAAEIARAVDSLAARVVSSGVATGFGVAVVMDGRTILSKAYGFADATNRIPADDRTLWYLASTSKSFTGFGISLLATQGVVNFTTPITTLLPGVRWPDGIDASRLTLTQFLSHTHYINDVAVVQSAAYTGAIPEARWPDLIRFATRQANDDLVYSNFGYNVAAMVIDRKRPEGWRRFLDSAVYKPAGLRETYAYLTGLDPRRIAKPHNVNPSGGFITLKFEKADATMNSAGGHVATLNDLARWTIVHMDGGRIDGKQVFPREAIELSHRLLAKHNVASSMRFGPFDREGWGAGWDLGSYMGEPMVSRFGSYSTTRSHLSFLPRRHIGVVAQVNGPGASGATDVVAALAYDLEAGRPNARESANQRIDAMANAMPAGRHRAAASDSTRRARQRPMRHALADYAGTYDNPALGAITISVSGNTLHYRWGVLDGVAEVFDADRDQVRVEIANIGNVLAFQFTEGGKAAAITWNGERFVR